MTTEIAKYNLETSVLTELDTKYKDFQLDPDNADSKAMLMAGLRDYRNMRLAVVEWHKVNKADIVKVGRALDAEKARVIDLISPGENHLKAIRKAEDDRLAEIEKKRVDGIRIMINDIRNLDYKLPDLNLKEMQELKKEVESTPITEDDYMEFVGEAMACVHNVLIAINNAIENRERLDKEEAKRKAENERLEKIRLEQEETQRRIDEANRKAAEAQAKLDEERRKIQVEKDKLEAEKQAEENRKRREEFEKQAKERAEKEAQEKVEKEKIEEQERIKTEEAEKKRQEELIPDKDKLLAFAEYLDAIAPPKLFKNDNCNIIINNAMKIIYQASSDIRLAIDNL